MAEAETTQSTEQQAQKMAMGDRAILPEGVRTIPIYIMGKSYEVPETLTIMKAMEYAGFKFVRGACQTVVEPNMYLTQIPFYPANRVSFSLEETEPTAESIFSFYPELFRCVACNSCTKACPMEVEVMDYISALKQGDIEKAAQLSFDCIQCGLCASRCMGELPQYHIAQLARRLYGKYIQQRAEHLKKRVQEIQSGKYDTVLEELATMNKEELEKRYKEREREPDLAPPGTWMPKETRYL
jgi:formate hydrogenlyase subunit 6/NADH:ubiquinone oxidoreductase subunit I